MPSHKYLIIQTAFIGDVVLATALVEKLHAQFPDARIDFLLRKGNEGLLEGHPYIGKLWIWDKKKGKHKNLLRLLGKIRKERYNAVINMQRFASTGLLTAFSRASRRIGFDKNPLSFLFTKSVPYVIGTKERPKHEVERALDLIKSFTDFQPCKPRLYPSGADYEAVAPYKQEPYICLAPASVWATKQFPEEKWLEFLETLPPGLRVYLLGGPSDHECCESLLRASEKENIVNLSGKLSFLQSAALMKDARMNYVNDSAPLHFCSAMNAPVTAVFCSTIPEFGFGPLSEKSRVVEIPEALYCRPCGIHGYMRCPEGHFNCAHKIRREQLTETLS